MRKVSVLLLVLAALLLVPAVLYDPVDEETSKFRAGAPTEEVLAARETSSIPTSPYGWLWKPALACAAIGGAGLFLSRRKQS